MAMTALVLLFLVSPGESDAAVTLAMRQAAIQVLGAATAIVIRESPDELSDAAAILQGEALHAVVVVRLNWVSPAHVRARLRVHLDASSGWTNREVGFEVKDAPAERGRALGYSVAAVVAGGAAPGSAQNGAPSSRPAATELRMERTVTPVATGPRTLPERVLFLDAAGATSSGLGGSGGQARFGWSMTRRLRFMLGGGARVGTVGVAQASSSHIYLTAGTAFDVVSFWRVAVAARGEALLVRQGLSHFSNDDVTPVKRARWLPGFRPQLELSVWPSQLAAVIASGGWELNAGATDVYVRTVKVAVIPASRLVAELGLRVHF
jgi:hypothetical protein